MSILEVRNISYSYQTKYQRIEALRNISCSFETGRLYSIVGHSGCGKTTLLSLLAGLDLPDEGDIYVDGSGMRSINRDNYRKNMVSMVYQSFNLFPLLSAIENVMFPMELQGQSKSEAKNNARQLIELVGLDEKILQQRPMMMSGGEQQRVAIARAVATGGKILLADEPTGNLDTKNGAVIADILKSLAHNQNYVVVIVTHNEELAQQSDIIYHMHDGEIIKTT
ncbi:MAG: ABC transporter ATP-binding protein [Oscillospiraceae bacterium]|jgi:putative ABC transport system ATP-binding protein|nr:ABC transporter ATP-binding protein [Oscillospiraceae bacterium]